jgi:hypothetical protein
MASVDKLIITNRTALMEKYGTATRRIDDALKAFAAADAVRGVTTRVVALDDAAMLKRYRAKPVASSKDEPGCKAAVDRLFRELTPDYVMILGARDVVPHQRLRNTKHDGDPGVPSDLPYACDEPWTRDPRAFLTPTRVVGRLPDVTGATDPSYLIALLGSAARYRSRPRDDYETFFGLSALAWQNSTELSLKNLFGASDGLHTSPPEGPNWSRTSLQHRVHFINCHGGPADTKFYGQHPKRERDQPDAMTARRLERIRAVREGSVVAAECCFGADLYDPKESGGQRGICYVYLARGCYGFLGSTSTAYGPAEGNGQADLLCQYFLERVLRGASLGRAALEARLRFVEACGSLQPEDTKTLAEFVLLGDPAVQPVERATHGLANSKVYHAAMGDHSGRKVERIARRTWILRNSTMMRQAIGKAGLPGPYRGGARLEEMLVRVAREAGVLNPVLSSARMSDPVGEKMWRRAGGRGRGTFVHTATGAAAATRHAAVPQIISVVATVRGGSITALRRLYSR